ncbi:MAG: hypothetical protein NT062_24450 [Proteobacteria bacterium]|nr:hypothetical protein [Pseudomonadota bacterium]
MPRIAPVNGSRSLEIRGWSSSIPSSVASTLTSAAGPARRTTSVPLARACSTPTARGTRPASAASGTRVPVIARDSSRSPPSAHCNVVEIGRFTPASSMVACSSR